MRVKNHNYNFFQNHKYNFIIYKEIYMKLKHIYHNNYNIYYHKLSVKSYTIM